jgi:16S rRNA (guanine527-N7)-methyltransferase
VKPELQRYVELVGAQPRGLVSANDRDPARLHSHVEDSLAGSTIIRDLGVTRLADVGSGGGFPAIPLALEHPQLEVDMIEARSWKVEFLRSAVEALDLADRARAHHGRVEELTAQLGRETFDAMSCRALAQPVVAAEYGAPLVRPGGHLLLWTTRSAASELKPSDALAELGLADQPELVAAASPLRDDGVILVWEKTSATAAAFPRRAGLAQRRPLA